MMQRSDESVNAPIIAENLDGNQVCLLRNAKVRSPNSTSDVSSMTISITILLGAEYCTERCSSLELNLDGSLAIDGM
jgi:hypothetical protein